MIFLSCHLKFKLGFYFFVCGVQIRCMLSTTALTHEVLLRQGTELWYVVIVLTKDKTPLEVSTCINTKDKTPLSK